MLPVSYRVLTLAAVLMTLPAMSSCNARKTMAEQTITHDTLHAFHTDTIRLSTHHSRADTVRESMVQVITLRQEGGNPAGAMANGVCHRYHRCLPPPRRFAAGDERPADGEAADRMALLSREMVVRRPLVDGCGSRGAEVFTKKQPSFK